MNAKPVFHGIVILTILAAATTACSGSASKNATADNGSTGAFGGERTIKVLSYNIFLPKYGGSDETKYWRFWNYRKDAVVALLKEEAADIFGLNECDSQQRDYIAAAMPAYEPVGIATDGSTGDFTGASNPVFYNRNVFTLVKWGTFWLSDTPETASTTWPPTDDTRLQYRSCTWLLLKHKQSNRGIAVFHTHLANGTVYQESRKNSLALIMAKMKEICSDTMPVVLTGDMNDGTVAAFWSPLREYMNQGYTDCATADGGMTYNAFNFDKPEGSSRLDHLFYRNFEGLEYGVNRKSYLDVTFPSDHFPVWAKLKIK